MKSFERISVAVVLSASLLSASPAGVWASSTEAAIEADETEKNSSEKHDFKSFDWGMKQEDIEAVEGTPDVDEEMSNADGKFIAYADRSVAGKKAILAYYFTNDQFYEARYLLKEDHSLGSSYISDYEDIKDALTSSLGETPRDYTKWDTDSHEDYYSGREGDALSYGYLSYATWFDMDNMDVYMFMTADNYDISTTVQFDSKTIKPGDKDYSGTDW